MKPSIVKPSIYKPSFSSGFYYPVTKKLTYLWNFDLFVSLRNCILKVLLVFIKLLDSLISSFFYGTSYESYSRFLYLLIMINYILDKGLYFLYPRLILTTLCFIILSEDFLLSLYFLICLTKSLIKILLQVQLSILLFSLVSSNSKCLLRRQLGLKIDLPYFYNKIAPNISLWKRKESFHLIVNHLNFQDPELIAYFNFNSGPNSIRNELLQHLNIEKNLADKFQLLYISSKSINDASFPEEFLELKGYSLHSSTHEKKDLSFISDYTDSL